MAAFDKSTIVRFRNEAAKAFFRYGEHVAPAWTGRVARKLWFAAPPRMADLPVPAGGEPFEVLAQGHVVRGLVWGASTGSTTGDGSTTGGGSASEEGTIYLVHGWGGRGSQFGALVEPLVEAGHRV